MSEVLDIDTVKELGGNESDLELAEVDDDFEELVAPEDDLEAEPVKRDEIRDFIKSLGFRELKEEGKEKKVKLKERPLLEEEKAEIAKEKKKKQIEVAKEAEKSNKEKKKKEKSKENVDFTQNRKPRKHLLLKTGAWQQNISENRVTTEVSDDKSWVNKMKEFAELLWKEESELYKLIEAKQKKGGTSKWLRTVLSSGTTADRLAALVVLVQDSPIHNLSCLDSLLTMAHRKGDRTGCVKCLQTMKELFTTELLLDDRKLRTFEQCLPSRNELEEMNADERERVLIVCYFESSLRDKYANYVSAVDKLSHDTVEAVKKKAIGVIFELLASKPEQEKLLLSMLVNKLGDPVYRVAANACHLLTKLVTKHPNMKFVIVDEVERLLFRPNISSKVEYYAVCFLNQLILSKSETKLASKLLSLYFSFFQVCVKKGDVDSKILSALLTGVNRAYPFVKDEKDKLISHADTLYRVSHLANFNTSVQALMLISHVINFSLSDGMVDRYFSCLYRKLLDPALLSASKQTWFLNLLYKSIKQDPVERRIQAFIKRLLQVCSHSSPPFICGSLVLLSQLLTQRPGLLHLYASTKDVTSAVIDDDDDDEEHFVDVDEEMNDNADQNMECSDDMNVKNSKAVKHATTNGIKGIKNGLIVDKSKQSNSASWVHRNNIQKKLSDYDPLSRNPQFCRAELECTWELMTLAQHTHPTVSLFAQTLIKGESIKYDGDPLQDFTLIRFLDRFVFRNPKKVDKKDGAVCESAGERKKLSSGQTSPAANSDEFLLLDESSVPAHEKFLYRYFQTRAKSSRRKNKKGVGDEEGDDSDVESVEDGEFDTFLDKFERGLEDTKFDIDFASGLKEKSKKKKQKAGDDDDDDDVDLSDEEIDFDEEDFRAQLDDDDDALMDDDEIDNDDDNEGDEGKFKSDVTFDEEDDDDEDNDDDDNDLNDDELDDADDNDDLNDDDDNDDSVELDDDDDDDDVDLEEDDDDDDDDAAEMSEDDSMIKSSAKKLKKLSKPKSSKSAPSSHKLKSSLKSSKIQKSTGNKLGHKVKFNSAGLFASVDEFSEMLQSNKGTMIGSDAVSRKDKAGAKQLAWEADRERWMEGRHWKQKSRIQNKSKSRVKNGRVAKINKQKKMSKKRTR